MDIFLLIGPPGSGKGTIANELSIKGLATPVTASQLLKGRFQDLMHLGQLINDDDVNSTMLKKINELKTKSVKRILLDGYPRTIGQAIFLINNFSIKKVFNLSDIDEEAIIKRLSGRVVCELHGHSFHSVNFPPKQKGICDHDGSKLNTRVDDSAAIVEKRLYDYRNGIEGVLSVFSNMDLVVNISAQHSKKEVIDNICDHF